MLNAEGKGVSRTQPSNIPAEEEDYHHEDAIHLISCGA